MSDGPPDIDAIGRKPLIQPVGHRAVEVPVIGAGVRAELPKVEAGVARFERVHRPRDDLDALVEAVIALSLLELLREPAPPIWIANGEHVRMVPEVVVDDPEESKHEPRWPGVLRRVAERDEPAVVHDGEHELGGTQVLYLSHVDFEKLGFRFKGQESVPHLQQSVQHGIYKGFAGPVALYALLGAVMFRNRKSNDESERES